MERIIKRLRLTNSVTRLPWIPKSPLEVVLMGNVTERGSRGLVATGPRPRKRARWCHSTPGSTRPSWGRAAPHSGLCLEATCQPAHGRSGQLHQLQITAEPGTRVVLSVTLRKKNVMLQKERHLILEDSLHLAAFTVPEAGWSTLSTPHTQSRVLLSLWRLLPGITGALTEQRLGLAWLEEH